MNIEKKGRPSEGAVPLADDVFAWGEFFDFKRVNPTRSMLLFAFGAVAGLAIAGYGLFTAFGTVTQTVPPEDIALINQRPILRTDFINQTETQYSEPFSQTTHAERLQVLQDMIHEELFVQRGLELDMPGTDPDTRSALVAAVEQQVVADVTTHNPTEAELMKYFQDHRAKYASEGLMTVHDLVLPVGDAGATDADKTKAAMAVAALRAGKSVDDVKASFGLKEEGIGDEQFYFAEKIHMGDDAYAAAVPLKDGQVSDPVVTKDGIHIVKMVKNVVPVPMTFPDARSQVLNDFKIAAEKRLEDADERYLREKADILIADDYKGLYDKATAKAEKAEAAATEAQSAEESSEK